MPPRYLVQKERAYFLVSPRYLLATFTNLISLSPHNYHTEMIFFMLILQMGELRLRGLQWFVSVHEPVSSRIIFKPRSASVNTGPFPSFLSLFDCTLTQAPLGTVLALMRAGVGVSWGEEQLVKAPPCCLRAPVLPMQAEAPAAMTFFRAEAPVVS